MTHPPTRNTRSIDSEKPTRNGLARRASSVLRNELFESTPLAAAEPPPCEDWNCCANAALAGSFSALWNSGVGANRVNAAVILSGTVENSTVRNTAVPMVPPI